MPKYFPLTYSNTTTVYGGTTVDTSFKNPLYGIHKANNTNFYSSADGTFDTYTFFTAAGTGNDVDSPQRAYTVVFIKNTGAHESVLRPESIELNPAAINAGFTLVSSISDLAANIDFDAASAAKGFLSPAEFNTHLQNTYSVAANFDLGNNLTVEGTDPVEKLQPTPILYLQVTEEASQDVDSNDFGATSIDRFIPIYKATADASGLLSGSSGSPKGISANNLGGSTVYPEYAAFLLKWQPTNEQVVAAQTQAKLTISFFGFESNVVFNLLGKSYRTGELEFRQGYGITTDTVFEQNSSITQPKSTTLNVVNAAEANITEANSNLVSGTVPTLESAFFAGHIPYGIDINSSLALPTNHTTPNSYWLKGSDTTANEGGVRVLKPTTTGPFDVHAPGFASDANYQAGNTSSSVFSYDIGVDSVSDGAGDGTFNNDTTVTSHVLQDKQSIIYKINRESGNTQNHYFTGDVLVRTLRPDSSDLSGSDKNFRPAVHSLPLVYNKFYLDGNSDEETQYRKLQIVQGVYRPLCTNLRSALKYLDESVNSLILSEIGGQSYAEWSAKFDSTQLISHLKEKSRVDNYYIHRHIQGNDTNGVVLPNASYSTVPKELEFDIAPEGEGTAASNSDGSHTVYKHAHIYDYFILPNLECDGTGSVTKSDLFLQFNAFSNDNFYGSVFDLLNQSTLAANNSDGVQENFTPITFVSLGSGNNVNEINSFSMTGATGVVSGNDITNVATVFNKNINTDESWVNASANAGFGANAETKSINMKIKYQPAVKLNTTIDAYDGVTNPPESAPSQLSDMLGRIYEPIVLSISNKITKAFRDVGEAVGSAFHTQTLRYELHGHCFPRTHSLSGSTFAPLELQSHNNSTAWTDFTVYITPYAGTDIFGTHDTSSANVALVNANVTAAVQNTTSTNDNTVSGNQLGSTNLLHSYASVNPTKDKYFRKYPFNGNYSYKYENYFSFMQATQQTTTNSKCGILPGPLKVGRFDDSGNALSAHRNSKKMLFSELTLNTSTDKYETFIPLNFANNSFYEVNVVSIELENPVGDSMSEGTSDEWGDPRFIQGSGVNGINEANGDAVTNIYGDVYNVPLIDESAHTTVAPTLNLHRTGCSNTSTTLTVPTSAGGTTGLTVGMKVFSNDDDWLASGTTIASITNNSSLVLSAAPTGNLSGKNCSFDYPQPRYAQWSLVRGKRTGNSQGAINNFPVKGNLKVDTARVYVTAGTVASAANKLTSTNVKNPDGQTGKGLVHQTQGSPSTAGANTTGNPSYLVGCHVIGINTNASYIPDGAKITAVAADGSTATLNVATPSTGWVDVKVVHPDAHLYSSDFIDTATQTDFAEKLFTGSNVPVSFTTTSQLTRYNTDSSGVTFYENYTTPDSQTAGAPYIHMAVDATSNAGINVNDIDIASFYNRVKIKYMVHNKLDFYGLNQVGITEDSIAGTTAGEKFHIYEDVYLVKTKLENKIADIQVTDIEGNTSTNNTTIDFGTLSAG